MTPVLPSASLNCTHTMNIGGPCQIEIPGKEQILATVSSMAKDHVSHGDVATGCPVITLPLEQKQQAHTSLSLDPALPCENFKQPLCTL